MFIFLFFSFGKTKNGNNVNDAGTVMCLTFIIQKIQYLTQFTHNKCHRSEESGPLIIHVPVSYAASGQTLTTLKMQCAKTHLHHYCCINRTTNIEGRLFLVDWRQRDYCWRSRPPASLWLANRWPLCQTWTMGQHYLHIKSLSEQESLSLRSPISLILKAQLVYSACIYTVSNV